MDPTDRSSDSRMSQRTFSSFKEYENFTLQRSPSYMTDISSSVSGGTLFRDVDETHSRCEVQYKV